MPSMTCSHCGASAALPAHYLTLERGRAAGPMTVSEDRHWPAELTSMVTRPQLMTRRARA